MVLPRETSEDVESNTIPDKAVTPDATSPSDNKSATPETATARKGRGKRRPRKYILKEDYIDIIRDAFWESKPWILT